MVAVTDGFGQATQQEEPELYHYARGTFRRLAETEYHQARQKRLVDYWQRPTGEEVVEAMMEKGFGEQESRAAVKYLWMEERRKAKERGHDV